LPGKLQYKVNRGTENSHQRIQDEDTAPLNNDA